MWRTLRGHSGCSPALPLADRWKYERRIVRLELLVLPQNATAPCGSARVFRWSDRGGVPVEVSSGRPTGGASPPSRCRLTNPQRV